jgi:hypothetical protein
MSKKPQLMTADIYHFRNGKCIWSGLKLPNIWHSEGQEFVLAVAFDTDSGITVPSSYYIGLDDRSTLAETDGLSDLDDEPSTNGYARQALSSVTGFVVAMQDSRMTARSGIATFVATTGSWGPVRNAFLSTTLNNTGYLIASIALSSRRTIISGDSISVRLNLSFANCS